MKRFALLVSLVLLSLACGHRGPAPRPLSDAGADAAVAVVLDASPAVEASARWADQPIAVDAGKRRFKSSQPGHLHRETNFIDGTGISTTIVDNAATGSCDVTITNTAPGGGGASSVTGAGATSCSPTTGAVVCTTPSVTVASGTGISVGGGPAYTVALSTPVSTLNGGTNATTLTDHNPIIGAGTGVRFATPSTAGIALVSNGATSDPTFTTTLPVGGGTGVSSPTAHTVAIAEGASPFAFVSPPATVGLPLTSGGSGVDPSFSIAQPQGGGTGQATITAHSVLIGQGTTPMTSATIGTAGRVLTDNGAGADPSFQAPAAATTNSLFAESTSAGSGTPISTGSYTNMEQVTVTIAAGQVLLVSAGLEVFNGGVSAVQYGIDIDATGAPVTVNHRIDVPTGGGTSGGSVFFRKTGLSAGTHTVRLVAGLAAAGTVGGGSLLTEVVSN